MNSFNIVHNRLIEKNFKALENEEIESLGFVLYENEKIRVLLKQIYTDLELENIQMYSNKIRMNLIEYSKNIYNTYLILCTDENMDYEKLFMIERNNIALRKYVIRGENDLKRIPFLDNTASKTESSPKKLETIKHSIELETVFTLLEKYDSKSHKLKDYQVEEIVSMIMKKGGFNYEYGRTNN